jgi:hypothetical protein
VRHPPPATSPRSPSLGQDVVITETIPPGVPIPSLPFLLCKAEHPRRLGAQYVVIAARTW